MPPTRLTPEGIRADEHERRISEQGLRLGELERDLRRIGEQLAEFAQKLTEESGKRTAHEEVCGVRYKALEAKVDKIDIAMDGQNVTLAAIRDGISKRVGIREALIGIVTLIIVPLVGFAGALLSGKWVTSGGN
jgi:hypothetical protein